VRILVNVIAKIAGTGHDQNATIARMDDRAMKLLASVGRGVTTDETATMTAREPVVMAQA
jgi:hypothetical protein